MLKEVNGPAQEPTSGLGKGNISRQVHLLQDRQPQDQELPQSS